MLANLRTFERKGDVTLPKESPVCRHNSQIVTIARWMLRFSELKMIDQVDLRSIFIVRFNSLKLVCKDT